MAVAQLQCSECSIRYCAICNKSFHTGPLCKRQCCSRKCKDELHKQRIPTPEQKLHHKIAMEKLFSLQRVKGLRKCSDCGKQKKEDGFTKNISKYKNTGLCLECKRKRDSKYFWSNREKCLAYFRNRIKDPVIHEKVLKIQRLSSSKMRIGTDRDKLITPETKCYVCGITQAQHFEKYLRNGHGISLSVHHIDDNGRRSMAMGFKPNNSPNNLMILCSADHKRQHNYERVLSGGYVGNGFKVWKTRRLKENLNK